LGEFAWLVYLRRYDFTETSWNVRFDLMPAMTKTGAAFDDALDTYRYLRAGMVVMVGMLAAGVAIEWINAGYCWQTSISAYYYTAAHSVFVAALCAIGVQLIVYKGSNPTEDTLLNLAGILAFTVAFVPTDSPVNNCGELGSVTKWGPAITNNVVSLMLTLILAGAVLWAVYRFTHELRARSLGGWVALTALWCVVLVGAVEFVWYREFFDKNAHNAAAVLMFIAIILTVCISAAYARRQDPDKAVHTKFYFGLYLGIASAMIVSLLAVGIYRWTHDHWGHWVIVIEALLVIEFAAYWVIQTLELWRVKSRVELLPEHLRDDAAHTVDEPTPSGIVGEVRDLRSRPRDQRLMRAL
jgi:uncharacterized membrane protein YidH (DUF202 family)